MSKLYMVLRADSKLIGTDILGRQTTSHLPKGHYAIPAFDTLKEAEEHADGRFQIIELSVGENTTANG